jgi:hypothetical protein
MSDEFVVITLIAKLGVVTIVTPKVVASAPGSKE